MTEIENPIDQALATWLAQACDANENADEDSKNAFKCKIIIGEFASKGKGSQKLLDLLKNGQEQFTKTLRQYMPLTAWPISLEFEISSWNRITLARIDAFNAENPSLLGLKFDKNTPQVRVPVSKC